MTAAGYSPRSNGLPLDCGWESPKQLPNICAFSFRLFPKSPPVKTGSGLDVRSLFPGEMGGSLGTGRRAGQGSTAGAPALGGRPHPTEAGTAPGRSRREAGRTEPQGSGAGGALTPGRPADAALTLEAVRLGRQGLTRRGAGRPDPSFPRVPEDVAGRERSGSGRTVLKVTPPSGGKPGARPRRARRARSASRPAPASSDPGFLLRHDFFFFFWPRMFARARTHFLTRGRRGPEADTWRARGPCPARPPAPRGAVGAGVAGGRSPAAAPPRARRPRRPSALARRPPALATAPAPRARPPPPPPPCARHPRSPRAPAAPARRTSMASRCPLRGGRARCALGSAPRARLGEGRRRAAAWLGTAGGPALRESTRKGEAAGGGRGGERGREAGGRG